MQHSSPTRHDHAPHWAARGATLVLAAAAWFSVLLQLWLSMQLALSNGTTVVVGLVVYLGYFTVLTNLLVAAVLTAAAMPQSAAIRHGLRHPQLMGCAAAAIAVVGIGYHLLLRNIWNPEGLQWVADMMLHYAMPVGYCLFWLLIAPKARLPWWSPVVWCAYPIAYLGYALVRGSVIGSYPYPFIDVAAIGYGQTALNAIGLMIAFVVVGWLLLALRRLVGRL